MSKSLLLLHQMPTVPNSLRGSIPEVFYSLLEMPFPIETMCSKSVVNGSEVYNLSKLVYYRIGVSGSTSHAIVSSESLELGLSSAGALMGKGWMGLNNLPYAAHPLLSLPEPPWGPDQQPLPGCMLQNPLAVFSH